MATLHDFSSNELGATLCGKLNNVVNKLHGSDWLREYMSDNIS